MSDWGRNWTTGDWRGEDLTTDWTEWSTGDWATDWTKDWTDWTRGDWTTGGGRTDDCATGDWRTGD